MIDRIEDRDGRVLVENRPRSQQVIDPQTAEIMTRLLMGVVGRGTATRVQVLGRPMGGGPTPHQQDPGRLVYRFHAVAGYRDLGGDG